MLSIKKEKVNRKQNLMSASTEGVVDGIKQAVASAGLKSTDDSPTHVGLGGDGCSTNHGSKTGVKAIFKREKPWLLFVWCFAHRLELAIKDALTGTFFEEVDDCLLKIYYLYEKSPTKLRGHEALYHVYSRCFEFSDGGMKPRRSSGTRWIGHMIKIAG